MIETETAKALVCLSCGCDRIDKAGLRYLDNNFPIQRFQCRKCGYRFSEKANKDVMDTYGNSQLGASCRIAKNLTIQAIVKQAIAGHKNKLRHTLD